MSIQITGGAAGLPTTGGTLTGPLEIAVGSAAAPGLAVAGDANTGLWAPAADTLAVSTAGVEAIRVTGAQFVGIGVAAPATELQVATTLTTSPRGVMSSQHSAGADGARFHMRKSRGTNASPTVITAGDVLGRLVASGYDGANYLEMGGIDIVSAGTIASTRVPTEIRFLTATDAAPSVLTQRMVIDKAGNVGVGMTQPGGLLHIAKLATDNPIYIDKYSSNTGHAATLQFRTSQQDTIGNTATTIGNVHGRLEWYGNNGITFQRSAYIGVSQGSSTVTDGDLTISSGASGTIFMDGSTGNVGIQIAAPTAALHLPVSTTARASLRIPAGTAPTIPNAGDIWAEGAVLKFFNGTTTQEIAFV